MSEPSRFPVPRIVSASLLIVLAACGGGPDDRLADDSQPVLTEDGGQPGTGAITSNALTANGLTSNGITANGITANGLTSNGLTSNGITANALVSAALDDPSEGANAALVIKYSVRCMLEPEQSVVVTYRDASGAPVTETYFGTMGLQPNWASEGLSDSDRLWWAACLGAHVNNVGPVAISVRSNRHPALTAKGDERRTYREQEGAIWATYDPAANPPLHFYSCRGGGYAPKSTTRHCIANEGCGSIFTYLGSCSPKLNGPCEVESGQPGVAGNLDRCHPTAPPWGDDPSTHVLTVFLSYD